MFYQDKTQICAYLETIKQIEEIYNWFKKQTKYHFYSSSLLIVYESDLEDLFTTNELNEFILEKLICVKMIDFTHVCPSNSIDENYLFGIERVLKQLKQLFDF